MFADEPLKNFLILPFVRCVPDICGYLSRRMFDDTSVGI